MQKTGETVRNAECVVKNVKSADRRTDIMTRTSGVLSVAVAVTLISIGGAAWGAFTTQTLELRQGFEPSIDGAGQGGVYSGTTDLYIDRTQPNQTFDAEDTIRFGLWSASTDGTRGYLRFNNFADYLPAGAEIINARVVLTSAGPDGGESYNSRMSYRTDDFDGITWATAGDKDTDALRISSVGAWNTTWAVNNAQSVSLTNLVHQWHVGGVANHGLQFGGDDEGTYWAGVGHQFYSSNYGGNPSLRPTLQIDFVDTVAESGKPVPGGAWYMTYDTSVARLNGPSVFEDTYVDLDNPDTNFSTATSTNLASWWGQNPTKRGLMRIDMDHPTLASLAQTGVLDPEQTVLKAAYLQIHTAGVPGFYLDVMRMASDWSVTEATGNTPDGVNPWPEGSMVASNFPTNVERPYVDRYILDDYLPGTTLSLDITDLLQGYVDGTYSNLGIFLGQDSQGANFSNPVYLTGYSIDWFQPMLVLELQHIQIPEPASGMLLCLGIGLLLRRRRK